MVGFKIARAVPLLMSMPIALWTSQVGRTVGKPAILSLSCTVLSIAAQQRLQPPTPELQSAPFPLARVFTCTAAPFYSLNQISTYPAA